MRLMVPVLACEAPSYPMNPTSNGGVWIVPAPSTYASASGQGRTMGRAILLIEMGSISGGRSEQHARRPRGGQLQGRVDVGLTLADERAE